MVDEVMRGHFSGNGGLRLGGDKGLKRGEGGGGQVGIGHMGDEEGGRICRVSKPLSKSMSCGGGNGRGGGGSGIGKGGV